MLRPGETALSLSQSTVRTGEIGSDADDRSSPAQFVHHSFEQLVRSLDDSTGTEEIAAARTGHPQVARSKTNELPLLFDVLSRPTQISSQYSQSGTTDSIASSYRPREEQPIRPIVPQATHRSSSSAKYPYQSHRPADQPDIVVADELIHHPTIIKLQQQNFHRLLSSAGSTTTSSSASKQQQPQPAAVPTAPPVMNTFERLHSGSTTPVASTSDTQRAALHQRKQALMKAIQNINQQMADLDMH